MAWREGSSACARSEGRVAVSTASGAALSSFCELLSML